MGLSYPLGGKAPGSVGLTGNYAALAQRESPDAVFIVTPEGTVLHWGTGAEALFRYSEAEAVGRSIFDLTVPSDRLQEEAWRLATAVAEGKTNFESARRRKDGSEFPVEIALCPLMVGSTPLVIAAIRDASHARNHYLTSMSHELRTPLNSIIGFTGTMLMGLAGPLNTEQESQMRTVQKSARHLLSLINDVLDLAKIEADKMELVIEPVDCAEVFGEILEAHRPLAKSKGLEVSASTPDGETWIRADRRALSQVLSNLTDNAIHFTESGHVRLALRRATGANGGAAEITIQDSGPGFQPEDLPHVFDPFRRFKTGDRQQKAGTGLGLYLSQRLTSLMGGRIECRSSPGDGTTFTVTLGI
jgi:PAS domain S-box-containing protein